jgi:hypothetical protein
MYSDLKERILPLIYDVTSPTGREIVKILDEYEKKFKGCICWCTEDFITRAEEKFGFTDYKEDDAQADLEKMIDNYDCNYYGITWDTVDYYIERRLPDNWEIPEEKEEDDDL